MSGTPPILEHGVSHEVRVILIGVIYAYRAVLQALDDASKDRPNPHQALVMGTIILRKKQFACINNFALRTAWKFRTVHCALFGPPRVLHLESQSLPEMDAIIKNALRELLEAHVQHCDGNIDADLVEAMCMEPMDPDDALENSSDDDLGMPDYVR